MAARVASRNNPDPMRIARLKISDFRNSMPLDARNRLRSPRGSQP